MNRGEPAKLSAVFADARIDQPLVSSAAKDDPTLIPLELNNQYGDSDDRTF